MLETRWRKDQILEAYLNLVPFRGELVGIEWDDLSEARRTVILRARKHPDRRVKEASVEEVPLITFGGVDTFAITPVPEPGSWALMLAGLGLLGGARLKARARRPA